MEIERPTLLDIFACHALTGLLSQTGHGDSGQPMPHWDGDEDDRKFLAELAYGIAAEMLLARQRLMEAK